MAAPVTGILDAFNGSTIGQSLPIYAPANWAQFVSAGHDLQIAVDKAGVISTGLPNISTDYWKLATFGPNSEVYVTVKIMPSATLANAVVLFARVANPTSLATLSAYEFVWNYNSAAADTFNLQKWVLGANSTIGTNTNAGGGNDLVAGDKLWLSCVGTTITCYRYDSVNAIWVQLIQVIDAGVSAAGFLALYHGAGANESTNFGGGTIAGPTNTVAPAVTGTARVGQTLSTTNGTWTDDGSPVFTYQWRRDTAGSAPFVDISAATASTYALVDADDGCHVLCVVTDTDGTGATPASSNTVGLIVEPAPTNSVAPTVSGPAAVGSVLSVVNGSWANMSGLNPTFTYQWKRAGVDIGGATAATRTTTNGDIGSALTCTVTATNTGGSLAVGSSNSITVTTPSSGGGSNMNPGFDSAFFG